MELEQLRVFAALCETGGFSAAARRLYKSHSSVSRAVSALERELGVTLCERSRTSFALTAAGERLYAGASALLREADELERRIKEKE
jgi:DNA-binding transcriptional LysR family regulator